MPKKKKGSTSNATRIIIAILVLSMVLPIIGTVIGVLF